MRCFLLLLFFLVFCSAFSDKIKKVEGEYTYYAPENVTIEEYPVIARIKKCMLAKGALGAMMSGSGPTVFGIFKDRKTAKAAFLK